MRSQIIPGMVGFLVAILLNMIFAALVWRIAFADRVLVYPTWASAFLWYAVYSIIGRGIVPSILGGFVAARIARGRWLQQGFLVGVFYSIAILIWVFLEKPFAEAVKAQGIKEKMFVFGPAVTIQVVLIIASAVAGAYFGNKGYQVHYSRGK